MKKIAALVAGVALILSAGVAGAVNITYEKSIAGNEFTSIYAAQAGFTTETFEGAVVGSVVPAGGLLWTWSGSATVKQGTESQNAAPYGVSANDESNYISVPNPASTGAVTVSLGGNFNYFGLWWGSIDAYNTLSFLKDGEVIFSVAGSGLPAPTAANGNQTADTSNLFVNFRNFGVFDSFTMASNGYAFEADNITVGVVPEPGTLMLLGAGLLGLVCYRRRIQK